MSALLSSLLVPLSCLVAVSGPLAQEPSAAPPTGVPAGIPATGATVELESMDGAIETRPLAGFATSNPRQEGAILVRLRGAAGVETSLPESERAEVSLSNGDRLAGRLAGGSGDRLELELPGGASVQLAVDALSSVLFPARIPKSGGAPPAPAEDADRLYVVTGRSLDKAEGFVESFDEKGVTFEDARVGARTYPWSRVAALFVAPLEGEASGAQPNDARVPVQIGLAGGGRLSGRLVMLDARGARIATPAQPDLFLPAALVREVAIDDGSFRFLSDIPVADGGPISFFGDELGFTWPHRVDANCEGDPLKVAGQTFGRGIGVHAPSRLTWRLDGAWRSLRLYAGVDDTGRRADASGSVRFRVLGDGQELWDSGVLRAGDPPLPSGALALEGVDELILVVEEVDDFVLDRANWLRPIVVRR